ncbi:Protein LOL1 [Cucurbita argyrosperma subsp. argyrosperma]|nr:Protein LOL1 [Cucurbita argyrosperma subsp. argyrosperma]
MWTRSSHWKQVWNTKRTDNDRLISRFLFPWESSWYYQCLKCGFCWSLATQSQLVCSGCRNLLLYPVGATSVCCAVCNAVTAVPPPGTEMAQLVCGGCHTLLMYIRGATSVQCSCCHTVNLALEAPIMNISILCSLRTYIRIRSSNDCLGMQTLVAHVSCGNCRMLLMYQYGARSVKCAVCNFVTSIDDNKCDRSKSLIAKVIVNMVVPNLTTAALQYS